MPIVEDILGPSRAGVRAWLAAVVVLLLVACANVAALMLVRAAGRSREYAVRLALGASRGALARLLFSEAVIISALASAAALAITMVALPGNAGSVLTVLAIGSVIDDCADAAGIGGAGG